MCRPEAGTASGPSGDLLDRINKAFGSLDKFKAKFTAAALAVFGSGYAWLLEDEQGALRITGLSNQVKGGGRWRAATMFVFSGCPPPPLPQECPLSKRVYPILVLDVWEHAYYLKHQNKRATYVEGWWKVVCWQEVEELSKYWQALRHSKTGHTEL